MQRTLRERFDVAMAAKRSGDLERALGIFERVRDEALGSSDAGERATYLQRLAGLLDDVGRREEALEAARAALAIDVELWPDGAGTAMTLHSIVLILKHLEREGEAEPYLERLLSVGEKVGGAYFAGAASVAHDIYGRRGQGGRVRPLLERARFACEVALREENHTPSARADLLAQFVTVTCKVAAIYALQDGDLARAERLLGPLATLLAPEIEGAPGMRRRLATTWSHLAGLARKRALHAEERLLVRCIVEVLRRDAATAGETKPVVAALQRLGGVRLPQDPDPLDVWRVLRAESELVVIHPLCGWIATPAADVSATRFIHGEHVNVATDATGRLVSVRRA
jgi:tetratricopeptide (TPR) repeat protein